MQLKLRYEQLISVTDLVQSDDSFIFNKSFTNDTSLEGLRFKIRDIFFIERLVFDFYKLCSCFPNEKYKWLTEESYCFHWIFSHFWLCGQSVCCQSVDGALRSLLSKEFMICMQFVWVGIVAFVGRAATKTPEQREHHKTLTLVKSDWIIDGSGWRCVFKVVCRRSRSWQACMLLSCLPFGCVAELSADRGWS